MGSPTTTTTTTESYLVPPPPPTVTVLSLRTGKVRALGAGAGAGAKKLTSAINKQPHREPVWLAKSGFVGDERDHPPHRSPDNAVHQYDAAHYDAWKDEAELSNLPEKEKRFVVGAFGENISTSRGGEGLSERNVCVGDVFKLGAEADGAVVQVSMTRQPCFKLNHRFGYKKMSSLVQNTGRTGWLYRVLREGWVQEGAQMELVERINPTWPLSRLQHYLYTDRNNSEALCQLTKLPGLGEEMVTLFQKRLEQGQAEDMNGRLGGDVAAPWRSYRLVDKVDLTPRVKKFVFATEEDIDDDVLRLGHFPHVRVKFGPEGKFTRAYSVVCGDMKSFELGVARDDNSRGGSAYLHDNLAVGDTLQVARGHTAANNWAVEQELHAKRHVFIIGGVGVTAFMGEIRTLATQCAQFEIHYAVRSRADAAFLNQLPKMQTCVYAKNEGARLNVKEVVPLLEDTASPDVVIYCCGPSGLIEETRNITRELGYPRSHTYFEEFGGGATGTGDPFEVEVESTGKVLQVPQEKSLLQILSESGFDIDSSCEVGNCGSCMVEYCKGEVVHKGVALDDEEKKDTMLACVSRGKGRITITC
ncbi:pyruvate kinase-like protein [Astrocystis sublimbata]|nr:pyruvate kinase-like protein [Astrocystis sublimbata]